MRHKKQKDSIERVIRQLTTGFLLKTEEPIQYHNLNWTVKKISNEKINNTHSILETLINNLK